jgi:hypothetical protein
MKHILVDNLAALEIANSGYTTNYVPTLKTPFEYF